MSAASSEAPQLPRHPAARPGCLLLTCLLGGSGCLTIFLGVFGVVYYMGLARDRIDAVIQPRVRSFLSDVGERRFDAALDRLSGRWNAPEEREAALEKFASLADEVGPPREFVFDRISISGGSGGDALICRVELVVRYDSGRRSATVELRRAGDDWLVEDFTVWQP